MKIIITLCITMIALKAFCPIIVRNDIESSKYIEFTKKPIFNCVGAVYEHNKFMASCVLVEENIILTDAHVLEDFKNGSIYEVKFNQQLIKVKNVIIHPKFDRKKINIDLVVAILESKVKNVIPERIYDGTNERRAIAYLDAMMNLPFTNDEETQLIIITKDAIRTGKFQNLQRDINKLKKAVAKSPLKPVIILERIIQILKSYPLKTEEEIDGHSDVRPVISILLNPEIIITESFSK